MNNNSDLNLKLRIRNDVFKYFKDIDAVADLYAGNLEISRALWSRIAKSVIAFDKNSPPYNDIDNVDFYLTDDSYSDFFISDLCKDISVVDCDMYGIPFKHIRDLLIETEVKKMIFFTDGSPTRSKKSGIVTSIDDELKKLDVDDYYYKLNDEGTAYYGWVYKSI